MLQVFWQNYPDSLAFTMQMKICLWHQLIKGPPRVGWAEPKTVLKDLRYLSLPQCLSWGKASEMNIKYKLYKTGWKQNWKHKSISKGTMDPGIECFSTINNVQTSVSLSHNLTIDCKVYVQKQTSQQALKFWSNLNLFWFGRGQITQARTWHTKQMPQTCNNFNC